MYQSKRWFFLFSFLGCLVLPIFIMGPNYFFSNGLLGELAPLQFDYAEKSWFFSHLRDGTFAWFYPHNQFGHNLATNPASGLLFLPNYIQLLLEAGASQKIQIFFFYIVLYLGFFKLYRTSEDSFRPSVFALLSVCLAFVSSLTDHVALGYFAFYPLAISQIRDLWEKRSGVVLGSISLSALFLLGDPLLILVAVVLGTLIAKVRSLQSSKAFAMTGALVILICLPHLVMMTLDSSQNSRSLGIDPFEALSYSTHPIRILDWVFPWTKLYNEIQYFEGGFNLQWWFPRIGGGVVFFLLTVIGLIQSNMKLRASLGLFIFFFIFISLGRYFFISEWLVLNIPILKLTRYPERYLLYVVPALLILAYQSFSWKSGHRFVWVLVGLAIIENLVSSLHPRIVSPSELIVDLPKSVITPSSTQQTRYLLCENGLTGNSTYRSFDVRASEMAMVNATSNWRSGVFKYFSCPWALDSGVRKWAPYSHVLSSGERVSHYPGLKMVGKLPSGTLWEVEGSRPWSGQWVKESKVGSVINHIPLKEIDRERLSEIKRGEVYSSKVLNRETNCDGFVDVFPSLDYQEFKVIKPKDCYGLMSLPLAFHSGWNSNLGEVVRLNDSTVGVYVPPGEGEFHLSYRPFWPSFLGLISLIIQLILWVIILRVLSPRKWTRSVREIKPSFNLF